jgi:hypothetical protein
MLVLPDNVEFRLGNFLEDTRLLDAPLVFIDVDPHDGIQEKVFHDFFTVSHFKGIVLWDDIRCNPEMEEWWKSIDTHKLDLSKVGHWSGTGLTTYE